MTKRPTTTTALSANFQASNALSPLLRMQHSALGLRANFATMRHRTEEPESSASSRSPVPFNGSDSHRTVRAVFCFSAATGRPLRRFCRRVAAIIVGTTTATAQQAQHNNPFGSSPSRRLRCERPRPKTTPHRPSIAKPTRSASGKRGASDENAPTYSRFPATFSSKSPSTAQYPQSRRRSVRPTASLRAKTPSISRFLPSDLHLCPFLPIFAPIHVRKTSHPPSSSGLGLDSSPRPAAAIGGENLSLP